jgi:D-alanyl-lipoteichoic acid acyltransferase DltB (MBOAT superfamily)
VFGTYFSCERGLDHLP